MANNKYEIALETLIERKEELLKELEGLEYIINSLKLKSNNVIYKKEHIDKEKNTNSSTLSIKGYTKNNSLPKKIAYFLKKEQRFLHFREIAEFIVNADGLDIDPAKYASKISSGSQTLKKKGLIVKYQVGTQNRNCFWGIPSWLNADGEIKNGHEFNKDYLSQSTNSENDNDLFNF